MIDDQSNRISKFLSRCHKQGKKRITIMLIPHTEKRIINLHLSLYSLFTVAFIVTLVIVFSVASLMNRTGKEIQYYDIGLGDKQFGLQAVQIAKEVLPLHQLIRNYTNTIAELYLKIDGDKSKVQSLGIQINNKTQSIIDKEIANLNALIKKCRTKEKTCGQKDTVNILQKTIYLSSQDTHNIEKSIALVKDIIKNLNTDAKKFLFENTPSIAPTQGYLLTPYGKQVDPLRGREMFKRGIEIVALPGTEVVATAPGEVIDISYNKDYGLQIRIEHKYGISTFYAHIDRARVKKGERVDKGEVIAYVGQTGNVAMSLLYYELHIGSITYNPYAFMNHLQDTWIGSPKI